MEADMSPAIEIDGLSKTERSPAIEMLGLSKTYRPPASAPVHAVVHVTLSVPAGQGVGVLGPNAARNTTLLQRGVALEAGPPWRSQTSVWAHLLRCGEGMDVGGLELKMRATQLLHE